MVIPAGEDFGELDYPNLKPEFQVVAEQEKILATHHPLIQQPGAFDHYPDLISLATEDGESGTRFSEHCPAHSCPK